MQRIKGTLRPSMLAFKLTDAVRSNFASAGFRATKKSKRATKQQHKELQSIGDATTSTAATIVVVSAGGVEGKKQGGADRKYVPPQVLGAKPTPSGGVMLPPTSRFSRASTLGTNMLETMSMRAPVLVRATTTSCEISWEPWVVGNETKLKQFEVSWRIVPGQRGVNCLDGWSSCAPPHHRGGRGGGDGDEAEVPKRDQLHFEATTDKFTSIPQWDSSSSSSSSSSPSSSSSYSDQHQRRLLIQGLPSYCPLVEFRVRAGIKLKKSESTSTLWGPYSAASLPIQTLDAVADPPMTGAITAGAIELRWGAPRNPSYGRTEGFTLSGKKAGSDTFTTIKSGGRVHSVSIRSVNSIPLTPNTTYVFKLVIRTSAGELVSHNLPVTTLPAPPDAPMPPVVVRTTARHIELRWETPDDHGSPVTKYVLYGRRHRTSRFKRLFTGMANSFVCGAGEDSDQLAPDTLYVFKIKAVNGYGDSPASTVATARTTQMSMAEAMSIAAGGTQSSTGNASGGGSGGGGASGGGGDSGNGNGNGSSSPSAAAFSTSGVEMGGGAGGASGGRESPPNSPMGGSGSGQQSPSSSDRAASSPDVQRTRAGTTLSTAPARVSELPNGWVECWDPGREICYYFNSLTGITQWIHPIHGKGGTDPDLNFRKKRFKLLYSIRERDWPQGGRKILKMTLRRSHLVVDSFEAIRRLDVNKLKLKTKVIFNGEEGIDSGGLTKEWFLELSRSLLDPQRCLLVRLEESVGSIKYHIDHRSSINEQHLQYFHFIGIILAKAVYDRQLLDLPLCKAVYKFILGRPMTLDDLEEMDPLYHRSVVWMLKNDIDGVIYETFTTTIENFGQLEEIELIPGGKEITVTNANKSKYVQAILDWRTVGSVSRQLRAIREGFQEVLPTYEMKDFTEEELNLLLNGKQDVNVPEMRQATRYTGGYEADSKPVVIFWKLLSKFTQKTRGQLLQFATGSSKVPLDGYDPCFTITMATSDSGTQALPTSHTCFNQLVLPSYDTEKEMETKLLYAFQNAGGFHMS